MPRATIWDVANKAGVSIKTVSRVVNKEANVRPQMRDRVDAAITQLGYRPNNSARSLAGNRSYMLGLLYDNPSAAYILDIQEGVLSACEHEGFNLLIHPCDYESPKLLTEVSDLLEKSRIDGLVLSPPLSDVTPLLELLRKQHAHYVRIAPKVLKHASPSVHLNEREAAKQMTQHLISLGHTRIAFIVGHPDHGASVDRLAGHKLAMQEAGNRVSPGSIVQGDFSFESGEACARKLLQRKRRPTAIFASNDYMAAGVMKVAQQLRISVPADLSIAGYDDAPVSRQIWPSLTTVKQPAQELASEATSLLIQHIRGVPGESADVHLDCTLVIRDSTSLVGG